MNNQQVAANAIDLSLFNHPADVREYCTQPVRLKSGQVIATDGVSLVMPAVYADDADALMQAPESIEAAVFRYMALFDSQPREWQQLSSLNLPPRATCNTCKGSGHLIETKCGDCDGAGEFQHGRYFYDCRECDGDGVSERGAATADAPGAIRCWACNGRGYGDRAVYMDIPGMPKGLGVNAVLLARFPADSEFSVTANRGDPVLLRGPGWRGMLMPMRG